MSIPNIVLGVLIATLAWPADAVTQEPIIDMHMHARVRVRRAPDGSVMPLPCTPAPCASLAAQHTTDDSILTGTLAAMEKFNVVKGFLGDGNAAAIEQYVKEGDGRFLPSINPLAATSPFADVNVLREAYKKGVFRGLGEIGAQYQGIPPNDSRLEPYFALAEELDIPVLIHTAGCGAPNPSFRVAAGRPVMLEDVIAKHPKLRLYFENAGYPFLDEAIALMTQYPQVYADLSTITWIIPRSAFYRYLRALRDAGLAKRLMWGSDQMEWPEVIGKGIDAIHSADFLSAEERRDILYNNAARFLRLVR